MVSALFKHVSVCRVSEKIHFFSFDLLQTVFANLPRASRVETNIPEVFLLMKDITQHSVCRARCKYITEIMLMGKNINSIHVLHAIY